MSDEVADSPKTETINTSGYWYGLLIPICLGLGVSFFSLMVLLSMTSWLLDNSLLFFFALLFQMGHAVLWPSSAAFIFIQGKKSGNLLSKNGIIWNFLNIAIVLFLINRNRNSKFTGLQPTD